MVEVKNGKKVKIFIPPELDQDVPLKVRLAEAREKVVQQLENEAKYEARKQLEKARKEREVEKRLAKEEKERVLAEQRRLSKLALERVHVKQAEQPWVFNDKMLRSDRLEAKVFYNVDYRSPESEGKPSKGKKKKAVVQKEVVLTPRQIEKANAAKNRAKKEAAMERAKEKQRKENLAFAKVYKRIMAVEKARVRALIEAGDKKAIERSMRFRTTPRRINIKKNPRGMRQADRRADRGGLEVKPVVDGLTKIPAEEMRRRWAKVRELEARGWRHHETPLEIMSRIPAPGTRGSGKFRERHKNPPGFAPSEPPFVELRVWVEGWSLREVQEKADWILKVSRDFGIEPKSVSALPKQVRRGTVLRSPFIYSKHRDAYQTVTHRRLIIFDTRRDAKNALLGKNAKVQATILSLLKRRRERTRIPRREMERAVKLLAKVSGSRDTRGTLKRDPIRESEGRLVLAHTSKGMYGGGIDSDAMLQRALDQMKRPEGSKSAQPHEFIGEMLGKEVLRFSEVLKSGAYDMKLKIKSRGIV